MPGSLCLFTETETQEKNRDIKSWKLLLITDCERFYRNGEFISALTFQVARWEDMAVGRSKLSSK